MLVMSEKRFKQNKGSRFADSDDRRPSTSSNATTKPKKGVLEPNVFAYYQRCNQILNKENEFENEHEKIAFLKTTFETLSEDGFKVFQNRTLSRVIESFLDHADFEILNTVLQIFGKNWETSATDRFAHRVLQKTLEVYQTCLNASSESVERGEPPDFMNEVVTKISEFGVHMYENYPHYMENQQASYILRTYLKVLSGMRVTVVGAIEEIELLIPGLSNYEFVLMDLSKSLLYSDNLKDMISQPLPNLFIQTIITCMRYRFPKELRKIARHILGSDLLKDIDSSIFDSTSISVPLVFTNHQGCYFMERLVRLMSKKNFKLFVDSFIIGKEEVLAVNTCASFVLQRVIERADDTLFLQLAQSLCRKLSEIFAERQFGLIHVIAVAAERAPDSQKRFVSALRKCLRCTGEDPAAQAAFLNCLTRMSEFGANPAVSDEPEEEKPKKPQLNFHGCLIAQSILRFKKTGFVVRSTIASSPPDLLLIGSDKMGNHVFEALFSSPSVADEFKIQIMERMESVLVPLACDKYGSRVMDCMWKNLDVAGRSALVENLIPHKNKLGNDRFGRFICQNFGLMVYHRKREWKQMQANIDSKSESVVKNKKRK